MIIVKIILMGFWLFFGIGYIQNLLIVLTSPEETKENANGRLLLQIMFIICFVAWFYIK
jgi:hypothetical protein